MDIRLTMHYFENLCINVKTVVLQKGVDAIRRIVKDFYKG